MELALSDSEDEDSPAKESIVKAAKTPQPVRYVYAMVLEQLYVEIT